MQTKYDHLGRSFSATRQEDPRIAARIERALGSAVSVVNVGAGTGNYESPERRMVGVEPSETMIRQRPRNAAPCVRGWAESLPFCDNSVDAALAVMTVHHWDDPARGLAEMRRVARDAVVLFTADPARRSTYWAYEYFPTLASVDIPTFPSLESFETVLGPCQLIPVPIPHDCHDAFFTAYWRRPAAFLDPSFRENSSAFSLISPGEVEAGLRELRHDLDTGAWRARHGHVLTLTEFDVGQCLVVSATDPVADQTG